MVSDGALTLLRGFFSRPDTGLHGWLFVTLEYFQRDDSLGVAFRRNEEKRLVRANTEGRELFDIAEEIEAGVLEWAA